MGRLVGLGGKSQEAGFVGEGGSLSVFLSSSWPHKFQPPTVETEEKKHFHFVFLFLYSLSKFDKVLTFFRYKLKREVVSSFSSKWWKILLHWIATKWNYKKKWKATTNNGYLCWCTITIGDDFSAKHNSQCDIKITKQRHPEELNHAAMDSTK